MCRAYMGSRATFTLGQFGGHAGRALRNGDVLRIGTAAHDCQPLPAAMLPAALGPTYAERWDIAVLYGPHAAPDFFTAADIETFFDTDWQMHYNSSRTGVRLIGPKPHWARADGGEAGLHPSNIHDNAYAIGAIDFTGDMPVILGPDGPSLGGFVCPATDRTRRSVEDRPAATRRSGALPRHRRGAGRRARCKRRTQLIQNLSCAGNSRSRRSRHRAPLDR